MRLYAGAALFLVSACAQAALDWERPFELDAKVPSAARRMLVDSLGSIYVGVEGLWHFPGQIVKFDSHGAYQAQFSGDSSFRLGRLNDIFVANDPVQRLDRNSGAALWTISAGGTDEVFIDELGSPYFTHYDYNTGYSILEKRAVSNGAVIWTHPVAYPMFATGDDLLAWIKDGTQWEMAMISKKFGTVTSVFADTKTTIPIKGSWSGGEAFFYKQGPYSNGLWFARAGAAKEVGRLFGDNLGPIVAVGDGTCVVIGKTEKTRYDTALRKLWRKPCLMQNVDASIWGTKLIEAAGSLGHYHVSVSNLATGVTENTLTPQMPIVNSAAIAANRLWVLGQDDPQARIETYDPVTLAHDADWGSAIHGSANLRPFAAEMAGSGEMILALGAFYEPELLRINKEGGVRWRIRLGAWLTGFQDSINDLTISPDKKAAWVSLARAKSSFDGDFHWFASRVNLANGAILETIEGSAGFVGANEYSTNDSLTVKKNAFGQVLWSVPFGCHGVIPTEDPRGYTYLIGNGKLLKLNGSDGSLVWSADNTTFNGPVHVLCSGDKVLVRDANFMRGFDAATGLPIWQNDINGFSLQPSWHSWRIVSFPGYAHIVDPAWVFSVNLANGYIDPTRAGFWDKTDSNYYSTTYDGHLVKRPYGAQNDTIVADTHANYRMYASDGRAVFMVADVNSVNGVISLGHYTLP